MVQPLQQHKAERFQIGPQHKQQFVELIFDGHQHGYGLERRWGALGRRGCKRDMGCRGGRNGGWSRSAEFEQFQWKLEQFRQ